MMDCMEYRTRLLSEPGAAGREAARHPADCDACREYTVRVTRFEERLTRAMRLPVGDAAGGVTVKPLRVNNVLPLRPRGGQGLPSSRLDWTRSGRFALAASVLLCAGVAGLLWLGAPRASLASDVVAHMAHEPGAWAQTDTPAPSDKLRSMLAQAHLRLRPGAELVSYAQTCSFRDHEVPHFVVQTVDGPMTVMVLVHDKVRDEVKFEELGYRGVIIPVPGHGSVAVLTRRGSVDTAAVQRAAAQLIAALDWSA